MEKEEVQIPDEKGRLLPLKVITGLRSRLARPRSSWLKELYTKKEADQVSPDLECDIDRMMLFIP